MKPDGTLVRQGAVPVKVSARVVRAGSGAPLLDLVHFHVRQRGLDHFWEPKADAAGRYVFEPGLLRSGVTWFQVARVCYRPVVVRARVEAGRHLQLGTIQLALDHAAAGTTGLLLSSVRHPRQHPVEVEEVLEESPADRAGLRERDELLEIDGQAVDARNAERLLRGPPGTALAVKVRRILSDDRDLRRHVRPRVLTLRVLRASGRPTRKLHPMWRA